MTSNVSPDMCFYRFVLFVRRVGLISSLIVLFLFQSSILHSSNSYEQLLIRIRRLSGSPRVRVLPSGKSYQGREIPAYLISNFRSSLSAKARIMIVAGQHGDEPNTVWSVLALSEKLSSGFWPQLVNRCVFIVVPVANPDGLSRHKRRNAQDIDINRDWESLRTPEARFINEMVQSWKPHTLIDVHEWTSPSSSKRNTIEVSTVAISAQAWPMAKLAKIAAIRSGLLMVQSGANANPGLLHRHYTARGFSSFLLETSAELRSSTKYRLYENAIIALSTCVSHLDRKALLSPASAGFSVPNNCAVLHTIPAKSARKWAGALIIASCVVLGVLFYAVSETERCGESPWVAVLLKRRWPIFREKRLSVCCGGLLVTRIGSIPHANSQSISYSSWKVVLYATRVFGRRSADLGYRIH
ncbi:MAG: M14 family zinc carboxypeptidase [Armatimonadota bacterium]